MEKTLLSIVLILIFTKLFGILSRKFKMPEVLGALVGGVLLGPIVLNFVHYDDDIKLLANLGVIMLMFLAGLETDVKAFKESGLSALLIAIGGIIIPLVLGTLGAGLFFNNFLENLFVGVILTATSVSITVETLKEIGKLNSKAGINILGAAVIDDILGLLLISIVLSISQTSDISSNTSNLVMLSAVLIKIIVFIIISALCLIYLPKFINYFNNKIKLRKDTIAISIAFALLFSYLSESFGIASITGAYIAGLILSRVFFKDYLERSVKSISSGFLSPIFFASIGLEASFNGFNSEILLITIVMLIIAVFGKLIGCGSIAKLLKFSNRESFQIGAGMVSRGEVALITTNIGLQKGIITEEIFLPTLAVVILTTIITPILLKVAFSQKNLKLKIENVK